MSYNNSPSSTVTKRTVSTAFDGKNENDHPGNVAAGDQSNQQEHGGIAVLSCTTLPCGVFSHPTHAVLMDKSTGIQYEWSSRGHRKMRFAEQKGPGKKTEHPPNIRQRIRIFSWEPHIVTWHICWLGFVANSLWVVNGVFATWPDLSPAKASVISYGTGLVGAFIFMITGYLGVVEVINQTHSNVRLPNKKSLERRKFKRKHDLYGKPPSAIGYRNSGLDDDKARNWIVDHGYPIVVTESGLIVTGERMRFSNDENTIESDIYSGPIMGVETYIVVGHHVFKTKILSHFKLLEHSDVECLQPLIELREKSDAKKRKRPYIWWTRFPAFDHIAVVTAYVFFLSTIIFFIPACIWYPMAQRGTASVGVTVFFVDILQVIPSIGFVYAGHAAMAEAAGSWWKPKFGSIGYNISICNTLGGYGFLLCGLFAIPASIDPTCCPNLIRWGSELSTFWGSCFFWIAGVLQCVEFASQHPITLSAD